MEKKFEKPTAIVITFINDDIITASGDRVSFDPLGDNGDEGELE